MMIRRCRVLQGMLGASALAFAGRDATAQSRGAATEGRGLLGLPR